MTRDQAFGSTLIREIWTYELLYIIVGPRSYRLFRRENFAPQKAKSSAKSILKQAATQAQGIKCQTCLVY